jgi:GT2 family glycosyltransferase
MVAEPGAPPVVAVVVTCRPGTWLEETLRSLAAQDYSKLSVLVVAVGDDDGAIANRVAASLPEAHLARAAAGTGFAQAANQGVEMVEGAAHILVCHDDVAPAPGAVRLLLEEAYRSNAGLTSPKFVLWDAPDRLLAVGMGADRVGVVNSLIEEGELDQGQHDVAREVFVAPAGAVLVRTDLWRALGGFNPGVGEPGEDLDLSWRAHVAGARVIVAPQARVRHLEAEKKGLRTGPVPTPERLRAERERHRLRTLWTCYGFAALLLIAPVSVLFALAECTWALVHRRPGRHVLAPLAALLGSLRRPGQLWQGRRRTQNLRRAGDFHLWKLQSRGSARLRAMVRLRLERGHELAWVATRASAAPQDSAVAPAVTTAVDPGFPPATSGLLGAVPAGPLSEGPLSEGLSSEGLSSEGLSSKGLSSKGLSSEGLSSEGLSSPRGLSDGLSTPGPVSNGLSNGASSVGPHPVSSPAGPLANGVSSAHPYPATSPGRERPASAAVLAAVARPGGRLSWKTTAITCAVVLVLLAIGSRDVLTQPLPLVGQLPSLSEGVGGWWHSWWNGAGPGGLSSSAFAPPGLLLMGVVGLIALGSANFAVHILVFGPLLLGPWGAYVQTRDFGSQRGRLAATVLYAALPIPFNALAQGHWAGLIAYAVSPWLIGMLCRLGARAPYPFVQWDRAWPRLLALSAAAALAGSLAPAVVLLVPVLGVSLLVGSVLAGRGNGGLRYLVASLIGTVVALVALAPWSFAALGSWSSAIGTPSGALHSLGLSDLLRLQTGPYGGGPLGWAVVVAAAIPLLIGRSWRLALAARLWVVVVAFLGLAWAGSRGWFPVPPLELLLAPAGAAMVLLVAVGAASVEVDVPGYRFGWRQAVPAIGALAVVAAALPLFSWVGNGQWGAPPSGAESAFAFPTGSQAGDYRAVWLGSAGSLPLASEGSVDGVAFATSLDGLPTAAQLWAPAPSTLSSLVAADLRWTEQGETTALGRLLAPLAVRYVVVPTGTGAVPALGQLVTQLAQQVDLVPVGADPSYRVFENAAWAPLFSVLAPNVDLPAAGSPWAVASVLQRVDLSADQPLAATSSGGRPLAVPPVAPGDRSAATGPAPPVVVLGAVPEGTWQLRSGGREVADQTMLGWASAWALPTGARTVTISRGSSLGQHLIDIVMLVVWALALWAAVSRLRARLGTQLTLVSLDAGAPGTGVAEIDWSRALEGESLG